MTPPTDAREILYYDGHCGLCHRMVVFVLHHEGPGGAFRFAPLQGKTFQARIPAGRQTSLSDTMLVETSGGSLLMRSDAWIHILRQLPGAWRIVGGLAAAVPRPLRDMVYGFVARVRYRVFGRRDNLCPVIPSAVAARFLP